MIGERLEEARKRKGISLREAAEATKIRSDYLASMEDNSFKINLPAIYLRGFLKNYARFLGLDPQKIITDFDAQQLKRSSDPGSPTRVRRETYGHIEIEDDDTPSHAAASGSISDAAPAPNQPLPQPGAEPLENDGHSPFHDSKTLYLKIVVGLAAFVIVTVFLILLVRLIAAPSTPEINPEIAQPTAPASTAPAQSTPPVTFQDSGRLTLIASDNVTVILEQTMDRKRLYSGSMAAGETLSFEREGPVSIRFSDGAALQIETNGETVAINQAGVGRTVID